MTPHTLIGRQVKVLAWDDLRDLFPTDPKGTITHVVDLGEGDFEVTVQVEGLAKNYLFGLDEVQILPFRSPISTSEVIFRQYYEEYGIARPLP